MIQYTTILLCYAMLCYAMLCYATLYYTITYLSYTGSRLCMALGADVRCSDCRHLTQRRSLGHYVHICIYVCICVYIYICKICIHTYTCIHSIIRAVGRVCREVRRQPLSLSVSPFFSLSLSLFQKFRSPMLPYAYTSAAYVERHQSQV